MTASCYVCAKLICVPESAVTTVVYVCLSCYEQLLRESASDKDRK